MEHDATRLRFPSPREQPLDPPAAQTALRDTCPVAPVELHDGQPAWLVTRYDDIREVLAGEGFSSQQMWRFVGSANRAAAERAETSFTVMDPPEHTRYRRMFTRYFTIRRVETLRPRMQQIVDDTLDAILARPSAEGSAPRADLVRDLALPVASQTMCALVGVPYEDHEWYEQRAQARSQMDGDPQEAAAATSELLAYMSGLVDRARRHPGDDIIGSSVTELLEPGLLTHDELVATLRLLLTAGHETTATMIATGTYVLLTHPDQLEEIRRDPGLLPGAMEELLRYVSMLYILVRTATRDTEIAGQPIQAGDGLILGPALANKDPRAFEDPNRFDIHRDNRHHVAFGFGPHQCLGQPVARLELSVVLATLIRRIPTLRLALDPAQVPFKKTNLVGVESLPVTW